MTKTYRAGRFKITVEDEPSIPPIDEAGERKLKRKKAKPLSFLPARKRGRPRKAK